MDIKTKSILLILLTFTLGIISGFFLHSIFLERQFRPMDRDNKMQFSLSQRLDDILELNQEQRQKINPIIKKYDDKVHDTIERNRNLGKVIMDSMFVEIKPFLSDKQQSLFENEMDHFKNTPPPRPQMQPDPQMQPQPQMQPDPQRRPQPRMQPDPQRRPQSRMQPDPQRRPQSQQQPQPMQ
jgi:hypothetical protein